MSKETSDTVASKAGRILSSLDQSRKFLDDVAAVAASALVQKEPEASIPVPTQIDEKALEKDLAEYLDGYEKLSKFTCKAWAAQIMMSVIKPALAALTPAPVMDERGVTEYDKLPDCEKLP